MSLFPAALFCFHGGKMLLGYVLVVTGSFQQGCCSGESLTWSLSGCLLHNEHKPNQTPTFSFTLKLFLFFFVCPHAKVAPPLWSAARKLHILSLFKQVSFAEHPSPHLQYSYIIQQRRCWGRAKYSIAEGWLRRGAGVLWTEALSPENNHRHLLTWHFTTFLVLTLLSAFSFCFDTVYVAFLPH